MALKGAVFVMGVIIFCSLVSSTQGRKLLMKVENSNIPPHREDTAAAEKVEASATFDEKLIARHLAALDRILRSVPSPGVGH
ncbi:hypothetical protein SASPL_158023 [Salvia splendens]|uniref:Uncharacterized protein n=1 Tax=Salvia splendens TaxID=180675 RepID=A0A8X8VTX5_SALSN|nr:hypothetical protein SASPL_158023 [Salvia splendens]